jgi:hypothetical protein
MDSVNVRVCQSAVDNFELGLPKRRCLKGRHPVVSDHVGRPVTGYAERAALRSGFLASGMDVKVSTGRAQWPDPTSERQGVPLAGEDCARCADAQDRTFSPPQISRSPALGVSGTPKSAVERPQYAQNCNCIGGKDRARC